MRLGVLVAVAAAFVPMAAGEDGGVVPNPLTAQFLAEIEEIPFGKLGAPCSTDYASVVHHGLSIVPELIELLDDPTPTNKRVPLTGGVYAVGDVAMALISDIIINIPWLEFITTPDDPRIEAIGFGVYWDYVRQSPANRADIKKSVDAWYRQHRDELAWRPIPEIELGGVFELPTVSDE